MTPEEFLAEVTGSDICPPGFKEDYAYFLAHQKAVLEILRAFHGICERNGINYHVTYGSLLGLIRDGGLIPWDYDIDVFVPISQKGELHSKQLSKLMTDEKIPRDERDNMYILCDGDEVLWLPGYRMSDGYKVSGTTKRVLTININKAGGKING